MLSPADLPSASDPSAAPYAPWLCVAVVGLLAVAIVGGALLLVRLVTRVVDRITPPDARLTTYECGESPVGSPWFRFNNRFTTVALTFLVFDVELALLWPILPHALEWIAAGRGRAVFAEVAVFVGVLALGLFWVSRSGGFEWDRIIDPGTMPPGKAKEDEHGARG
ncbi:MAG: NADH-quinone oxidoreductase subunit A [Planctomycetota bacterium]